MWIISSHAALITFEIIKNDDVQFMAVTLVELVIHYFFVCFWLDAMTRSMLHFEGLKSEGVKWKYP